MLKTKKQSKELGQSLVEIIIAVSIFVVIAGSAVVVVLGSMSSSRLGEEETQASFYAVEGLEVAKSIKNKNWMDLQDGDHGLSKSSGEWVFVGASDSNGSNDKFTRVVNVSSVYRGIDGNIVDSGGSVDSDTKKVTSTISWDFTPGRPDSVQMVEYLTNWQESINMTCSRFCSLRTYTQGTCRKNVGACNSNGETHESDGDIYCTQVLDENTCCCLP
jgi:type II secretory pathway pseudopilin PulG